VSTHYNGTVPKPVLQYTVFPTTFYSTLIRQSTSRICQRSNSKIVSLKYSIIVQVLYISSIIAVLATSTGVLHYSLTGTCTVFAKLMSLYLQCNCTGLLYWQRRGRSWLHQDQQLSTVDSNDMTTNQKSTGSNGQLHRQNPEGRIQNPIHRFIIV
jgi:hypothetical protein